MFWLFTSSGRTDFQSYLCTQDPSGNTLATDPLCIFAYISYMCTYPTCVQFSAPDLGKSLCPPCILKSGKSCHRLCAYTFLSCLSRDQHLCGGDQQRQQCPGGGEPALWLQRALRIWGPKSPLSHLATRGQAEPAQWNCATGPGWHTATRPLLHRAQQLWGHPDGAGAAWILHSGDLQQCEGRWRPLWVPCDWVDADAGRGVADGGGTAHEHACIHHCSGWVMEVSWHLCSVARHLPAL